MKIALFLSFFIVIQLLLISLFLIAREIRSHLRVSRFIAKLTWDNVISIERHPVKRSSYIVTFKGGPRFVGSSTVWHFYPSFRSAGTAIDYEMWDVWERFEHEGFKGFFPGNPSTPYTPVRMPEKQREPSV